MRSAILLEAMSAGAVKVKWSVYGLKGPPKE
jgi:hypothetical protein